MSEPLVLKSVHCPICGDLLCYSSIPGGGWPQVNEAPIRCARCGRDWNVETVRVCKVELGSQTPIRVCNMGRYHL